MTCHIVMCNVVMCTVVVICSVFLEMDELIVLTPFGLEPLALFFPVSLFASPGSSPSRIGCIRGLFLVSNEISAGMTLVDPNCWW